MVDFPTCRWTFRLKLVALGVVKLGFSETQSKPRGANGVKSILAPFVGGMKGNGLGLDPAPKPPTGAVLTVVNGFTRLGELIELAPIVPSANGGLRRVCSVNSSSERL